MTAHLGVPAFASRADLPRGGSCAHQRCQQPRNGAGRWPLAAGTHASPLVCRSAVSLSSSVVSSARTALLPSILTAGLLSLDAWRPEYVTLSRQPVTRVDPFFSELSGTMLSPSRKHQVQALEKLRTRHSGPGPHVHHHSGRRGLMEVESHAQLDAYTTLGTRATST